MKRRIKTILIIILLLAAILFLSRLVTPREIDDVNPAISCENEYLDKSDIFWIVPIFHDTPISENKTWCNEILSMNKTLGMHGIYHEYHEFADPINETDLRKGMREFQLCFNQTPKLFKAPNLALSKENELLLQKYNLTIRTAFDQAIHKVYHCDDTGVLSNSFHDLL